MIPKPSYFAIRAVLLVVCVSPLVFGAAALTSGDAVAGMVSIFSLGSVTLTPELNYLLKPLGLYVFMFGVLVAYAVKDPVRNRAIITWGALLLLLRALQRLYLTAELNELFMIPVTTNLLHVAYLSALSFLLFALRPKSPERSA